MRRPLDLAFEACGDGDPVLLLHGLYASSRSWRRIADGLALTHRVIAVDLRNHGRSPRAVHMSYLALADDLLELIQRQSLGRPYLVGHGLGGKVAMALALTAPYAVGGLTVIDVAPHSPVDRAPVPMHGNADPAGWLPAITLWLHELGAFPNPLHYLSTGLPLHAVLGSLSDCVQPADASAYRPMFPAARVEVIDGAGHWVHADRPQALLASLRRALANAAQAADVADTKPPTPTPTQTQETSDG